MKRLFPLVLCLLLLAGCKESAGPSEADPGQLAEELGNRWGLRIHLGWEALEVHPWDYTFTAEEDPALQMQALEALGQQLQVYPGGMLRLLSQDCGGLHISIVKEILGTENSGSLPSARGLQFRDDRGETYIVLARDREYTLYHELCHVMEDYLMPRTDAWKQWEDLNPPDFHYDLDFEQNRHRDGDKWLQPDTRAFIDTYSMSFPREDRARVMEYAMTEGNRHLFSSPVMQKKLRLLSEGIRKAFGLEQSSTVFLWEQYLTP